MKVLAVSPHPDDAEFGCGGTLLKLARQGHDIHLLHLTAGERGGDPAVRRREAEVAARLLGAAIHWGRFPDRGVLFGPEAIDRIRAVIAWIEPAVILAPSEDERHPDHGHASRIVIAAAGSRDVLLYETFSSRNFLPEVFGDISRAFEGKMRLLRLHASQAHRLRGSGATLLEAAGLLARSRGQQSAVGFAEAFQLQDGVEGVRRSSLLRRLDLGPSSPRPVRDLTSVILYSWEGRTVARERVTHIRKTITVPHEVLVVDVAGDGFAGAINRGIAKSKGRYVVWLCDRVDVPPHWLDRLIGCLERAPGIAAAGPATNEGHCDNVFQAVAPPHEERLAPQAFAQAWALAHAGRARLAPRLGGFCLLHRKDVIERVGLLDERFAGGHYADVDYCLKLGQAGYALAVARDTFVGHRHDHMSRSCHPPDRKQTEREQRILADKWCRTGTGLLLERLHA